MIAQPHPNLETLPYPGASDVVDLIFALRRRERITERYLEQVYLLLRIFEHGGEN